MIDYTKYENEHLQFKPVTLSGGELYADFTHKICPFVDEIPYPAYIFTNGFHFLNRIQERVGIKMLDDGYNPADIYSCIERFVTLMLSNYKAVEEILTTYPEYENDDKNHAFIVNFECGYSFACEACDITASFNKRQTSIYGIEIKTVATCAMGNNKLEGLCAFNGETIIDIYNSGVVSVRNFKKK